MLQVPTQARWRSSPVQQPPESKCRDRGVSQAWVSTPVPVAGRGGANPDSTITSGVVPCHSYTFWFYANGQP